MPVIEVKLTVSQKILDYLNYAAQKRGLTVDDIVSEVVKAYFDDYDDAPLIPDESEKPQ